MRQPLLSIVVPTKDRYFYLEKLIELIDSFQSADIELVLQDNTADNSKILEFLSSNRHLNIRYAHKAEVIPISYNSDLAILNSTGEYVCFIGDDDGVTKYIIECVKWMRDNDIEVVVPSIVSYDWPDAYSYSEFLNQSGKIVYEKFTGEIREVSALQTLYELMEQGFIHRGDLPLVYHGIVKRSVLNKIYDIGGTFFPGASPDIANGVALSLIVKNYVHVNMPIIISGASKHHAGGVKKIKNRAADIDLMTFLPPNAKKEWEKKLPKIWTGETVWAESAIKALRYMGREDLIVHVNFEYLYSTFVTFHFGIRSMAYELTSNKIYLLYSSSIMIIKRYINALLRMCLLKLKMKKGKCVVENVIDIIQVVSYLQEKYKYKFPSQKL